MLGFWVFRNIYFNLGEKCQNRVLGNIFGIRDVSASSVSIRYDSIVFSLFSKNVFYRYSFRDGVGENSLICDGRIVSRLFFISNDIVKEDNNFIYQLINLFRCQDEYQIYCMFKLFL